MYLRAGMKRGLATATRLVASTTPASVWLAAFVQTVFLIALWATDGYDAARTREWLRILLTYATVAALFGGIELAFGRRPRAALGATLFVYTLFVSVNFARFETAGSFDYGFAHENARELLTPLGRAIVTSNVKPIEVVLLFAVPLGLVLGLVRARRNPSPLASVEPSTRRLALVVSAAIVIGLPAARITTHESLTGFGASAIRFWAETRAAEAAVRGAAYPFVHDLAPSEQARKLAGTDAPRPHVIILFLESWSARYATPIFDARRREGLTYDHFYGNSVQSARGHYATLCSLLPMYRAKESIDLPNNRWHCLPQVLADAGYRTMFQSATDEPEFDRAREFFGKIGFAEIEFEDPNNRGRQPLVWGAGLQDDAFYRRLFARIDRAIAEHPDTPVFAVGANASNHYPFDKKPGFVPASGYPTKYQRNYLASLHDADAWLATFFEELERRPALRDAIVVLVGDHSFPADEHGIHFNGLGAYDEAFRTAFMLRWPGHVAPAVVSDEAASQIDIAPTLVDLLQLRGRSHFVGRSLVAKDDVRPPPSPLVQPYDGVRLAAVRWPLKLIRHESAQQEQLYDLARDPDEKDDRIGDPTLVTELPALREAIGKIPTSQALVRANRVWPPSP